MEASKIVADAVLGIRFENIRLGGKYYQVKNPSLKTIAEAISVWAELSYKGQSMLPGEAAGIIGRDYKKKLHGLAVMIAGGKPFFRLRVILLYHRFIRQEITALELKNAVIPVKTMIEEAGKDFFESAASLWSVTRTAASQK